jgi:hypothetical protein
MFEAIIDFWTLAVVTLQRGVDGWATVGNKARETIHNVADAVSAVHDLWIMLSTDANFRLASVQDTLPTNAIVDRTTFPCDNLEPPRPVFGARVAEKGAMKEHLNRPDMNGVYRSYSIYGMPGVGKTALALRFAHDCLDAGLYDAVFWIRAEDAVSCSQSITEIAPSS